MTDHLDSGDFFRDMWVEFWRSVDDGLHVSDGEGRYLYVNPAYCTMVGYTEQELLGQTYAKVVPPEGLELAVKGFQEVVASGLSGTVREFPLQRKDGSRINVSGRHSLLRRGDETYHAFVVRDITEQRAHEQRQYQANRVRALGLIAGGVAHEFNNLLVGISGYAELIEQLKPLDIAETQQYARKILHAAQRGTRLTNRLLPFAGKEGTRPRPSDIHEILEDVVELFESSLGNQVRLEMDLQAEHPWVLGDRIQLQEVFLNVLLNTLETWSAPGALAVATRQGDAPKPGSKEGRGRISMVTVRVREVPRQRELKRSGIGTYFSHRDQEGGGALSMALVYQGVEDLGGEVSVQAARKDRGAMIEVRLPSTYGLGRTP